MSDVLVDGVTISDSNRGVGVWQVARVSWGEQSRPQHSIPLSAPASQRIAGPSGGWMGNITVRNTVIETRFMYGSQWWGSGEGLVVTSVPENAQQVCNIYEWVFHARQ